MELRFFGATGDTTGSCHQLSANGGRILLDCGLYQGRREESWRRNREFPFSVQGIEALVQSHAHIDHCGKLPMLVREGFSGAIHATHGTRDLCELLLHDSAQIQLRDAQEINRRRSRDELRRRRKKKLTQPFDDEPQDLGEALLPASEVLPLYLDEDVRDALRLFEQHRYGEWFAVARGIRARFHDAGHILGPAWVELEVSEEQRRMRAAEQRRAQLHGVVSLSRFLIRPSVQCRNLASRLLSMSLERMKIDFQRRYQYRPWLVESFLDRSRFSGVTYRASNWILVGQTQGRGRQDRFRKRENTIKDIYV